MDEGEKTAPNISDQLAKIINSRWLNKLNDESLREKLDAHLRPANCDRLITPEVNPEIWGRLDKETRAKDLKLSYLQSNLTAVGNIMSKTTDMLLKATWPSEDGMSFALPLTRIMLRYVLHMFQ